MNLTDYQRGIDEFIVYPMLNERRYLAQKLISETGEVSGVDGKYLRDDFGDTERAKRLLSEAGDVLWYIARMFTVCGYQLEQHPPITVRLMEDEVFIRLAEYAVFAADGFLKRQSAQMVHAARRVLYLLTLITDADLEEIAACNFEKLSKRQAANVIQGSGESIADRKAG